MSNPEERIEEREEAPPEVALEVSPVDAATPAETPRVELTHTRMACQVHAEVFRADWPKGFIVFGVKCFENVMRRSDVQAEVHKLGDGIPAIEAMLDIMPACCRVSRGRLVEFYEASGVGVLGRCEACHRRKQLGTAYKTTAREYKHLCFTCVANAVSSSS